MGDLNNEDMIDVLVKCDTVPYPCVTCAGSGCAMPASVVASFVGYVDYDAPSGLVIDHNLELVTATKIVLRLNASHGGTGSPKFTCGAYTGTCSTAPTADEVYDAASTSDCAVAVTAATTDVTDSTQTKVNIEGLTPATEYKCYCAATSAGGSSLYPGSSVVTTRAPIGLSQQAGLKARERAGDDEHYVDLTVWLVTQPTGDVTVTIAPIGGEVTVSHTTMTFTSSTYGIRQSMW